MRQGNRLKALFALFASFVTAVVGACILIALGRLITGNRAKV